MDLIPILLGSLPLAHNAQHPLVGSAMIIFPILNLWENENFSFHFQVLLNVTYTNTKVENMLKAIMISEKIKKSL